MFSAHWKSFVSAMEGVVGATVDSEAVEVETPVPSFVICALSLTNGHNEMEVCHEGRHHFFGYGSYFDFDHI